MRLFHLCCVVIQFLFGHAGNRAIVVHLAAALMIGKFFKISIEVIIARPLVLVLLCSLALSPLFPLPIFSFSL